MRNSSLSVFLGLTAAAVVSTPMTAVAQSYDYSKVENLSTRPIESDNILYFLGEQFNNEGFVVFANEDRNAPDAGHERIGLNAVDTANYYVAGRRASPEQTGATRDASLQSLTGLTNLFSYLNNNNISLSSIGVGFSPKNVEDFTKTWNLGEDKRGQDWFARPDSAVEEYIYRANPDEVEIFLSYGTTKIVDFGYSDIYFISDNSGGANLVDNWNIVLTDPIPAFKASGLDPLASGLADAFLKDVAVGGGSVQFVSEDKPVPSDFSFSSAEGYRITNVSFPTDLRIVSSKRVPEPSTGLGFLMFGVLVAVARKRQQKQKQEV
ncbi:PEP-CTERM sorting domain-containing protein [Nostoc sp. FACHB-973]|nr:PEP-CTERM sorting domain-containing protein [Nostoc sp. FACHB-973]